MSEHEEDFTDPVEHIHECVGCSVQWVRFIGNCTHAIGCYSDLT